MCLRNFSHFFLSPYFTNTENDAHYYQELSFEESYRRGEKTGLKYAGVTSKPSSFSAESKAEL